MCFKSPKPPKPPAVQPAPRREDAMDAANSERKKLSGAKGVFGNIFTSALGDTSYGANATKLATLGA